MFPQGRQGDGAERPAETLGSRSHSGAPSPTACLDPAPGASGRGARVKAGLWLAQRGSACLHCERVLAAILSSQLRAGPREEQVVSWAQAAQRYQTMSGGGLTSSLAVKNRIGKTCCQSTFAVSPFPGPQKSPKEAGAFDGCLPDLLPCLLLARPDSASSHASPAPSVSSLLALRQDSPRAPSHSWQLSVTQGERSRLRNQ